MTIKSVDNVNAGGSPIPKASQETPVESVPAPHEVCMVRRCVTPPMEHSPMAICFGHLREIAAMYEVMYDVALNPNISRREALAKSGAAMERHRETHGVVYYVRIGNHIKIGTSIDVQARMKALYVKGDALLATEPGSYGLETRRHREFIAERIDPGRELFNPSPRLLEHVNNLRQANGQDRLDLAA